MLRKSRIVFVQLIPQNKNRILLCPPKITHILCARYGRIYLHYNVQVYTHRFMTIRNTIQTHKHINAIVRKHSRKITTRNKIIYRVCILILYIIIVIGCLIV